MTEQEYIRNLERTLVQLRTMYDNVIIEDIVDAALRKDFDAAWFIGFKKFYREIAWPELPSTYWKD